MRRNRRTEPSKGSIVRNANGRAVAHTYKHDVQHLDRIITERSLNDAKAASERAREARAEDSS